MNSRITLNVNNILYILTQSISKILGIRLTYVKLNLNVLYLRRYANNKFISK